MSYTHLSDKDLQAVKDNFPKEDKIDDLVGLFKLFGDQTRLSILMALMNRELCVHDICKTIDVSQSAVSHQLRNLREAKLVKSRRVGKEIIYSLDDDHVKEIYSVGLAHILESK